MEKKVYHKFLEDVYLEWFSYYFTVEYMAEQKGISEKCLGLMIEEGKKIHEEKNLSKIVVDNM